jgi:hypothetical protein
VSLPPADGGSEAIRPFLSAGRSAGGPPQVDPRSGDPPAETLRPFVLTSGRVDGADREIGLETQVTARSDGSRVRTVRLTPELRAIVAICASPISVAEISSRLRLHLGVVKVLVSDLRSHGYLDVHTVETPNKPDLILRVIRGLSAIS